MAETRAELAAPEAGRRLELRAVRRVPALGVVTGLWVLVFTGASVLRHDSFHSHRFDLGNMTQVVWNTAHGRLFEMTSTGGAQFIRLGAHVDPFLALLTLPWLVWPNPLVLLALQSFVVAFGAVPVYALARKHTGSPQIALRFAAAYLLYPATQWNILGGFHPVTFAVPFLLFAIWYLDEERLVPFAVFAVLAGSTQEQVPLLVAGLGLWHAARRSRAVGLAIAGAGVAWFAVDVFVVLPHFAPPDGSVLAHRYASIGGSGPAILHTLASDPSRILGKLATVAGAVFVVKLLVPLAGLSLLEPGLAACAVPGLAICLLADKVQERSVAGHYTANLVPFLVGAAVLGAARLGPARVGRWSSILLAATILANVGSPLRAIPDYVNALRSPANGARLAAVRLVPAGAPVASTNNLGGHLSERRRVYSVPVVSRASWIVVDENDPTLGDERDPRGFRRFLGTIERAPEWRRVFAADGVLVFRRV